MPTNQPKDTAASSHSQGIPKRERGNVAAQRGHEVHSQEDVPAEHLLHGWRYSGQGIAGAGQMHKGVVHKVCCDQPAKHPSHCEVLQHLTWAGLALDVLSRRAHPQRRVSARPRHVSSGCLYWSEMMLQSLPVVLASFDTSVCFGEGQEVFLLRISPVNPSCHHARSIHAHIDGQDEVRHPRLYLHTQHWASVRG